MPWSSLVGHLATLTAALPAKPSVNFRWERLTLPDGDFCDLAFAHSLPSRLSAAKAAKASEKTERNESNIKANLWLLPGLSSRAGDSYLYRFLAQQGERPWQAIIWHGRGQSGVLNRRPRFWSAVDFADFLYVLQVIKKRFPERDQLAVGFSMGALVLLHALAEDHSGLMARAAAVAVPLQPAAVAERLNQGFSKFYRDRLLRKLERQVQDKFPQLPRRRHRDFRAFDAAWTAPLHDFQSVDAYYQAADITKKWTNIHTPTLLLQARDDPFFPEGGFFKSLPPAPWLVLQAEKRGGHLGFRREGWQRVWDFLDLFQSDTTKLE